MEIWMLGIILIIRELSPPSTKEDYIMWKKKVWTPTKGEKKYYRIEENIKLAKKLSEKK